MDKIVTNNDANKNLKVTNTNNVTTFLKKYYSLITIYMIGLIGWILNICNITIILMAIATTFFLIYYKDVKYLLPISVSFSSLITNLYDYVPFIISASIIICALIYIALEKTLKEKKVPKKGKMFWGFVGITFSFTFSGLIGFFRPLISLLLFTLCLTAYFIYWLIINFSKETKKYFLVGLLFTGLLLSIQFFILLINSGNIINTISNKLIGHIGLQNINNVAVYLNVAMMICFYFGYKNKHDWLYTLFALFFEFVIFLTCCRIGLLISTLFFIIGVIILFIKSNNKKIFFIYFSLFLLCLIIITISIFINENIKSLFNFYLSTGFSGRGREELWPWCWEHFRQSPFFGIGMYTTEKMPYIQSPKVTADNTVLQYLLSTGIVGSLLAICFYIFKYRVLIQKFNSFKLFNLLFILIIALNGITSQAPTTDFMMVLMTIVFVSLAEIDTAEQNDIIKNKNALK